MEKYADVDFHCSLGKERMVFQLCYRIMFSNSEG